MRDYYSEFLEKKTENVLDYEVSKVSKATLEDKTTPFDTFDTEQTNTNLNNLFVDRYNAPVDLILSNEDLQEDFHTILDEQKAILMIDGGMNEADAESRVTQLENLRHTAILISSIGDEIM